MGRTKEKEFNSLEVLLKAIIKSMQHSEDIIALANDLEPQLVIDTFISIVEDAELVLVANKEHEKFLVHNNWKKSSNVKDTIYDSLLKRLTVQFNNGGVYDYEGVPKKMYKKFEKAESVGKFLTKEIIPKYKCFKRK